MRKREVVAVTMTGIAMVALASTVAKLPAKSTQKPYRDGTKVRLGGFLGEIQGQTVNHRSQRTYYSVKLCGIDRTELISHNDVRLA